MKLVELFESKEYITESIDSLTFECELDIKDQLCDYIKRSGGEVLGAEPNADQCLVLCRGIGQETIDKLDSHPKIVLVKGEGIQEAPYGTVSKLKDKVVGGVKGLGGGGQIEKGRQDSGKQANVINKEFKTFLGQSGGNPKMFSPKLLSQFFHNKGFDASNLGIPQQGNIDLKTAGQYIMKLVQQQVSKPAQQAQQNVQEPVQQSTTQVAPQQTKPVQSGSNELWDKVSEIAKDPAAKKHMLKILSRVK